MSLTGLDQFPAAAEFTNLAIDTTTAIRRYLTGELARADLEQTLANLAIGSTSRFLLGAGAVAAFGPGAPAAIGCLIGHRLAVATVSVLADLQREGEATQAKAMRGRELARQAEAAIRDAERRLEDAANTLGATATLALTRAFDQLHTGLESKNSAQLVDGLVQLAELCRRNLMYIEFDDFNTFMTSDNGERLFF
jgi:hypothetical protein